jgi:small ligand-binding sensory domain FIST
MRRGVQPVRAFRAAEKPLPSRCFNCHNRRVRTGAPGAPRDLLMKWASAIAVDLPIEAAVDRALDGIEGHLSGAVPDLLLVFVSEAYQSAYERIPDLVARRVGTQMVVGCSGGGVIGSGREVEHTPAVSLTAAVLPGVDLTPLRIDDGTLPAAGAPHHAWEEVVHVSAASRPHFLLLADPFTLDAERLLRGLDDAFPEGTKVGGLASGGAEPGANALYLGRRTHRYGLVGIALTGNVEVDTIVAQGCRPVGEPMFVTRCERNVLYEIDGSRPVDVLQEMYQRSDPRERELFERSLFVGIVMRDNQVEYGRGDFLIRNIIGADRETGRLAVGALLREGMVVQFHLRDAATSAEDLRSLLSRYERGSRDSRPEGSVLFSCLGRGAALYGEPDHDTTEFHRQLGDIPLGGFFCNGEIGPVHGTTFLHGYTSSFGLFRSRR